MRSSRNVMMSRERRPIGLIMALDANVSVCLCMIERQVGCMIYRSIGSSRFGIVSWILLSKSSTPVLAMRILSVFGDFLNCCLRM
jgi:hypothetical protein